MQGSFMQNKQWISSTLSVESFYSFLTDFLSTASPPQKLRRKNKINFWKTETTKQKTKQVILRAKIKKQQTK